MSMAIHRNIRRKDFRRKYPWEDLKVGEQFRYTGCLKRSTRTMHVQCMVWSYKLNRRFIGFRAEDGKYYIEREK